MICKKKPPAALVRSSAAEYLTFVAASGGVEAVYADENVWLSQKMMAQLYDAEVPTINYHLKKVFEDSEFEEGAVLRSLRITAADGKTHDAKHYNLKAHAESEFEKYRIVQDRLFESDFDRVVAETRRLSEGATKDTPRKGREGKEAMTRPAHTDDAGALVELEASARAEVVLPADAHVIGEPVTVTQIRYSGVALACSRPASVATLRTS